MRIKTIVIFVLALLLTFDLSMTSYGYAGEKKVLKIGVEEDRPLSFNGADSKAYGFSMDIIGEICEENGIEVEYVPLDLEDGIDRLERGEIDVLTLGYSKERAEKFRYSQESIIENWGTVISSSPSQRLSDMSGKTVAVVAEDIYAQNFKKLASGSPYISSEPKYIYAKSYDEAFKLVQNKEADYGVVSRFSIAVNEERYDFYEAPVIMDPVEIRYAFRSDIDSEIYDSINDGIAKLKKDSNSYYYNIIDKWFGVKIRTEIPQRVVWFLSGLIAAVFALGLLNIIYKNRIKKNEDQLVEKNRMLREKNESIYRMNEKLSHDVEEIRKSKETIYKMAYYDQLTGLFNKNSLYMDMRNMCKQNDDFSVVFFDLDNFKMVNDTLGFLHGDELLKNITSILVNESDCKKNLYRWGGDEFVFLCREMKDESEISIFCSSILKRFENPIKVGGMSFFPSASIGVSRFPKDARDHEGLIKKSNAALHYIKKNGKNGYKIHSDEITVEWTRKLELDANLREAIREEKIRAYFQPRVSVDTGEIVGMEALARWIDEEAGLISPAEFIPLAEENGLICKIGEAMLRQSCIQTKLWNDMGYGLSVSVNLSSRQLENEDILEQIDESLSMSGLESRYLELEITESSIIENMDSALKIIEKIRKKGIKVLLDDFGTGYSSLNYLKRMPIDTIKIDKSFIDRIVEVSKEMSITSYIISLAHDMGLTVVAEGVEQTEQANFLREKKCDEIQGFLFSRPLPACQFEELLKNGIS